MPIISGIENVFVLKAPTVCRGFHFMDMEVVHGEKDDVVPLQDSIEAAKRYKNCELTVISGDTHSFDYHQDQMADVIYRWMLRRKNP